MKSVLITGGAGFIGSHTVDFCLQKGMRVTVMDNLSTGKLGHLDLNQPQLTLIQDDILNYPKLVSALTNCDAVLHLAAIASVPKSIENPVESLKVNTLGFVHLLQAIREINRPMRFVYASSAAVYGDNQALPNREDGLLGNVLSPYALEKMHNERYAAFYEKMFAIKSLGLRYFNVYGHRQDPQSPYSGVISRFIDHYRRDLPLTVFGDGEQSRDFIHVSDVARANYTAIHSDYCGLLNIATGKKETLNHLVKYIAAAGQKPAKVDYKPPRAGDIHQSYASIESAKQCLNYQYTLDLAQGIEDLLRRQ